MLAQRCQHGLCYAFKALFHCVRLKRTLPSRQHGQVVLHSHSRSSVRRLGVAAATTWARRALIAPAAMYSPAHTAGDQHIKYRTHCLHTAKPGCAEYAIAGIAEKHRGCVHAKSGRRQRLKAHRKSLPCFCSRVSGLIMQAGLHSRGAEIPQRRWGHLGLQSGHRPVNKALTGTMHCYSQQDEQHCASLRAQQVRATTARSHSLCDRC